MGKVLEEKSCIWISGLPWRGGSRKGPGPGLHGLQIPRAPWLGSSGCTGSAKAVSGHADSDRMLLDLQGPPSHLLNEVRECSSSLCPEVPFLSLLLSCLEPGFRPQPRHTFPFCEFAQHLCKAVLVLFLCPKELCVYPSVSVLSFQLAPLGQGRLSAFIFLQSTRSVSGCQSSKHS